MKITTSQKIWVGLLGVGVCALAVDRLRGGDAVTAADAGATGVINSATATGAGLPSSSAASVESLVARLAKLDVHGAAESRDAFAPPASWSAVQPGARVADDERAARFRQSHNLRAVLRSGDRGQAMIDGTLVSVGQSIDGFKLIEARDLRAVFADGGVRVVFSLDAGLSAAQKGGGTAANRP